MVCSGQAAKARNAEIAKGARIPPLVPYELRDQWHPTRNGKFEYGKVHISEKRKVWWMCDHCGHEWEESVRDRTRLHEYGAWDAWHKPYCRCPECGGTLDSLAWHYPSLAAEWSSENPVSAWDVRPNSTTLDFVPRWICTQGHTWSMPLASRIRGATCP
ncbi:MAG: zinc-ribbon domain-containing protein, partial [Coriobacteriales bacterium]|nr:zinc-ribbon domain-containing protein [Coriobacteriales bacterium]